MKKGTTGRVFRCAALRVILFILVSTRPLGAVEPAADETERQEGAACEAKQTALSPPIRAGEEFPTLDPALRPVIDAATPRIDEAIVGIASFYDYPQETASGEPYDAKAFTAAAQLEIRERFGGIRFGRLYQPAYAIAEHGGKKLIIKFNDVGPLMPGRKFDLSRAAMEYFEGLDKGLLEDFKVTPLPLGRTYAAGPITDADLIALGIGQSPAMVAQPAPGIALPVFAGEPAAADAAEPQAKVVPLSPFTVDDFVPAPVGDVADLSVVQDG